MSKSVLYATGFMSYFLNVYCGNNIAAIHPANAVGGNFFPRLYLSGSGRGKAGRRVGCFPRFHTICTPTTGCDELQVSKIAVVVLIIIGQTI
ncbi:MAG: Cation/acetate symporter ActP [Sodalis sp.]|nr:MAG: Cation/acetate symporter ActP [Sodalis sp.]